MKALLWGGLAFALAMAPSVARARPPAMVFDVPVGKEEFFRAVLKAVAVDDPGVAQAELLPSQEVLLTAVRPGRALLYLEGEAKLEVVRLRVYEPGSRPPVLHATEEQRAQAKKACPGFHDEGREDERTVAGVVSSPACRKALRELFACDEYSPRRLELTFTPETLGEQLEAIRSGLKAKGLDSTISVGYSGLTLVLKGKATARQKMELMAVLYDNVVGPVLFDDQVEDVAAGLVIRLAPEEPEEPAPDGGKASDAGGHERIIVPHGNAGK